MKVFSLNLKFTSQEQNEEKKKYWLNLKAPWNIKENLELQFRGGNTNSLVV